LSFAGRKKGRAKLACCRITSLAINKHDRKISSRSLIPGTVRNAAEELCVAVLFCAALVEVGGGVLSMQCHIRLYSNNVVQNGNERYDEASIHCRRPTN